MEEEKAHNLYALFSSVDAGARQKRGLGFSTGVQGTSNRQSGDALTFVSSNSSLIPSEDGREVANQVAKKLKKASEHGDRGREKDTSREFDHQDQDRNSRHPEGRSEERRTDKRNRDNDRDSSRRSHRHADHDSRSRDRERSRRDSSAREDERRHHSTRERTSLPSREHGCRSREDRYEEHHSAQRSRHADADRHDRSRQHSRRDDQSRKQDSAAKPEQLNFRELISGYDQMSAGERMKARTKLLLERTDKTGKDDRQQWTRFVFNKDALLDEEGAQPDNAFGGGANAVSLKVPAAQARQNERILSAQEAHEAAIFGLPAAGPQSSPPVIGQHAGLGARPPSPEPPEQLSPDPPIHAETVQNQAAVSWRERAAQLRAQRQAT